MTPSPTVGEGSDIFYIRKEGFEVRRKGRSRKVVEVRRDETKGAAFCRNKWENPMPGVDPTEGQVVLTGFEDYDVADCLGKRGRDGSGAR
mmetsp:Transcript_24214/g.50507  ORF Transcript_24214/g.50507 Transcript_24214/m.50507 type:complete len:90 (-) Transcript_24214:64-333(-)